MNEFRRNSNLQLVPLIDNNFKLLSNIKNMIEMQKVKSIVNNSNIKREKNCDILYKKWYKNLII